MMRAGERLDDLALSMTPAGTRGDAAFLETANVLGARLCRDAIWAGARCNWLGDAMELTGASYSVVHRACGPELYNGTAGIALFLARLYALTGEKVHRAVATAAARHALSRLGSIHPVARIGFYSGASGIAHALLAVGEQLDEQHLIDQSLEIVARLDADGEHGLDVISGVAGAIPALLDIHARYSRHAHYSGDRMLEVASRLGDRLLAAAHRSDAGWSWDMLRVPGQRDLTGFSHGTAGIGWSLLELHRVTGEARFREAAEHGFLYERNCYSAEQENWPDFRTMYGGAGAPVYAVAWCHGAPGIGLSRLRAFQFSGDATCRAEAEAALRTTTRSLGQALTGTANVDFSPCHGLAGNAELLLYARDVLGAGEHDAVVEQVARRGIELYRKTGARGRAGCPAAARRRTRCSAWRGSATSTCGCTIPRPFHR